MRKGADGRGGGEEREGREKEQEMKEREGEDEMKEGEVKERRRGRRGGREGEEKKKREGEEEAGRRQKKFTAFVLAKRTIMAALLRAQHKQRSGETALIIRPYRQLGRGG